MPINCAIYRDKIVKIGDFSSVFFEKISIHKDFDERIMCSPGYDRNFFKSRLTVQIEAILKTWDGYCMRKFSCVMTGIRISSVMHLELYLSVYQYTPRLDSL
jgi:hypothetical protein